MSELVNMMEWLSNFGRKNRAEYKSGGLGEDLNKNCKPEFDCSGLITAALWRFGIKVDRLSTGSIYKNKMFQKLDKPEDVQPDDIIVIKNQSGGWHAVGAVTSYDKDEKIGKFFGMQSSGPDYADFGQKAGYWNGVWKAYRLKDEYRQQLKVDLTTAILQSFSPYTCSPSGWPKPTKPEEPNKVSLFADDWGQPAAAGSG